MITAGQMVGTLGHDQPLDNKALLEGKISHRKWRKVVPRSRHPDSTPERQAAFG